MTDQLLAYVRGPTSPYTDGNQATCPHHCGWASQPRERPGLAVIDLYQHLRDTHHETGSEH